MSVYSQKENNECVVFIKMIMRCIEIKFFIDENVVCNNIDHEIRYVIDI